MDFSAASPLLAWSKLMGIGRKKELQPISLQWERGRALEFLCCSRLQEEQQHCLCPLGWATAHSLLHGDKNTFLPCQDVTRIKKYIKDSWMVSYYGNTATWQCRGALRPYLPCLRSALCIHAAETWMCLALLQGHSAMPLLPLSAPPFWYLQTWMGLHWASTHSRAAPDPWWLYTGISILHCRPRSGHNPPGVASPDMSRWEGSPPLICWWSFT